MPSGRYFRAGYFVSKANSYARIDTDHLGRELTVRRIQCEVPGCTDVSCAMLQGPVPAFVCRPHSELCAANRRSLLAVEASITLYLKGHVDLAASQAYEGSEEELDETVTAEAALLVRAISCLRVAELVPAAVAAPKVRPTLSSLPKMNELGLSLEGEPTDIADLLFPI